MATTDFAWPFGLPPCFFRFSVDLRTAFGRSGALSSAALALANLAWSSQPSASEGRKTCFRIYIKRTGIQLIKNQAV